MELATINQNPYKLALTSPKILDIKKSDAAKSFVEILSKTYYDSGQAAPGYNVQEQTKNLQVLSNSLHEEVKNYFPYLRIEEIRLAFANGVRKEYGDFFGLNISTFNLWIKGFLADQRRKEAKAKIEEENKQPVKPLLTPTEAEYEWKLAIQNQFEEFKKTGVLKIEFPKYQFEEFKKRGLIKLNQTEYELILDQAKDNVSELHRLKRLNPKTPKERDNSTRIINEIACGQMKPETEIAVKNEARKIAITIFYQSITELKL